MSNSSEAPEYVYYAFYLPYTDALRYFNCRKHNLKARL